MRQLSGLFGKKTEHSSSNVNQDKLNVEQVVGTSVIGWAATAELAPAGKFHILVDGTPFEVAVTPIHRLDVCQAIGAPDKLCFGFRVVLPISLWNDLGECEAREVLLCAENAKQGLSVARRAADWPVEISALSNHSDIAQISLDLLTQLASRNNQTLYPPEASSYFMELGRKLGWKEWPKARAPSWEGLLESASSLVWSGWLIDTDSKSDHFQLFVNGQEVQIESIRVDRSDVAEAKGTSRANLGFEISMPASIWSLCSEGSSIAMELWAGSCRLTKENIIWNFSTLNDILCDCYQKSGGPQHPKEVVELSGERQYYFLLCIEHLIASKSLLRLPKEVEKWFLYHAQTYGVEVSLALPDSLPPLGTPRHSVSTTELWRLLREFNEAVDADGANAKPVLQSIWQRSDIDAEVRHQLTCALIPFFCGVDRYEEIRPFLDIARLKAMSSESSAWSLSIQIPEAVWISDYSLATKLTSKIAYEVKGWINTECIAAACRRSLQHWPASPQLQHEAEETVSAVMGILEAQSFDYWGRSHDKNLVNASVSLIILSRRIISPLSYTVLTKIIHHFGFNPIFWSELTEHWGNKYSWPAELKLAHQDFERYRSALTCSPPDLPAVIDVVLPAAVRGSLDASIALREATLATALGVPIQPEQDAQRAGLVATCTTLSPNDIIRFSAHMNAPLFEKMDPSAVAEIVERSSGVPRTYFTAARNELAAWFWGIPPAQPNFKPSDLELLCSNEAHGIGVLLAALFSAIKPYRSDAFNHQVTIAEVSRHWLKFFHDSAWSKTPPSVLLETCQLLATWQLNQNAPKEVARMGSEFRRMLCERYGAKLADVCLFPDYRKPLTFSVANPSRNTLVAIYSCNKYLHSRVKIIQDTWAQQLDKLGIPWIIVVGDGDGTLKGNLLSLNVRDNYESLPQKTIALIEWVYNNTNFSHLFKIDDDCHVAVDRLFSQSPHWGHHYLGRKLTRAKGATDRNWHQARSESILAQCSLDKSPEPSVYADGGSGYFLSRFAMFSVLEALTSTEGARLTRGAFMEDKLIGDLLSLKGIHPSEEGYDTLVRRRFGNDPVRVSAFSNGFYPSRASPTMVCHLDDAERIPEVNDHQASSLLRPVKIWPSYTDPKIFSPDGSNQLELLSTLDKVDKARSAEVIVVAVARNEMTLLPHFLDHYRSIGVQCFIIVDNLSDDGTRSFLHEQPDVILYSADTEYKKSHFGVAWQQAVLSTHALGKWVILADIDEFLVFPTTHGGSICSWLDGISKCGHTAIQTLMIDMYPQSSLDECDFRNAPPFDLASHFDSKPLIQWKLGSGCFSNSTTWLSGLRHRLIEDSAPNLYTSQKFAVLKYYPWMRLSEGLHYVSNTAVSPTFAVFAHFKYHAGFKKKVLEEISRKQHFNGAEEYLRYTAMFSEISNGFVNSKSVRYECFEDFERATFNPAEASLQTQKQN